jgi:hypothetical protein
MPFGSIHEEFTNGCALLQQGTAKLDTIIPRGLGFTVSLVAGVNLDTNFTSDEITGTEAMRMTARWHYLNKVLFPEVGRICSTCPLSIKNAGKCRPPDDTFAMLEDLPEVNLRPVYLFARIDT